MNADILIVDYTTDRIPTLSASQEAKLESTFKAIKAITRDITWPVPESMAEIKAAMVHNGIYTTSVGICYRITEGSEVQVVEIRETNHAYVYGVNGGCGYIRYDLLTYTGRNIEY